MVGEKCAVFGVYGKGFEAARLAYFGLYALQHRGQEGSGITTSDGSNLYTHKKSGLVAQVYSETAIHSLLGYIAIGHNRYSTSKGGDETHLQPVIGQDKLFGLVHNGNLPSTTALEKFLKEHGIATQHCNDSELMAAAIKYYLIKGDSIEEAVTKAYPLFTGAFSILVITAEKLIALRDNCGIRPLCLGSLNGGYCLASETCALDTVHAEFMREVEPGEMLVIDDQGLHSYQLAPPNPKLDIFEFVYFSRPDSNLLGISVDQARYRMGVELAREFKIEADIVVPVPDSAIPAALGFAKESGIPYYPALIKNRYIGRTFIQPEQHLREWAVEMKLNTIDAVLKDKRVIIVDDSIVRGTTSPSVVSMLRKAGATEVHFIVSSPPYRFPDYYGIDTPAQDQLLAYKYTKKESADFLGANSLHYLSYDGLIKAIDLPENQLCTSCFTGEYPIDIAERKLEIKL